MILTTSTKIPEIVTGYSVTSYNDAVSLFRKGEMLQKIADEARGSALQWVKENEPDRYDRFVKDMGIGKGMANKLIKHVRLVKVARKLGEAYPTKASVSQSLKGKTPEAKLDHYREVQEAVGKQEPTRRDIENYKKKLYKKEHVISDIRKSNNSIEGYRIKKVKK